MADTEFNFEKYAAEGNRLLKQVAERTGEPRNTARASRIVRTVLHGVRDAMMPGEAADVMSQLPLVVKGVFADGWKIGPHPKRFHSEQEFIDYLRESAGGAAARDFGNDQELKSLVKEVIGVLEEDYWSEGQVRQIRQVLPEKLRTLF